jgi:hypothetical protein
LDPLVYKLNYFAGAPTDGEPFRSIEESAPERFGGIASPGTGDETKHASDYRAQNSTDQGGAGLDRFHDLYDRSFAR